MFLFVCDVFVLFFVFFKCCVEKSFGGSCGSEIRGRIWLIFGWKGVWVIGDWGRGGEKMLDLKS